MRNRFPGTCYRCGKLVAVGDGHFERLLGGWRTQHASCAIKFRGTPDPVHDAARLARLRELGEGTGKTAQRARARLRKET